MRGLSYWDSYPEELGKTLWQLYHTVFGKDLEALLKTVIDDHPAGWSGLHASTFDGRVQTKPKTDVTEPESAELSEASVLKLRNLLAQMTGVPSLPDDLNCYCHGDNPEKGWQVNEDNASGSGVEYVYAFAREDFDCEGQKAETAETAEPKTGDGAEKHTMFVLSSYRANGHRMIGMFGCGDPAARWRVIAQVDLGSEEPDWQRVADGFAAPPLQ